MELSIPCVACICFFQAYNGMYARYILRCSLTCFQIKNLSPSRIYRIPFSRSFTPKALERPWKQQFFLQMMKRSCGILMSLYLETPIWLLRAVFLYNGKNFCLWGGAEQHNLKLSQFQREVTIVEGQEVSGYIYTEFGSKSRQGGFTNLNLENKVVRQFQNCLKVVHVMLRFLMPTLQSFLRKLKKKMCFISPQTSLLLRANHGIH